MHTRVTTDSQREVSVFSMGNTRHSVGLDVHNGDRSICNNLTVDQAVDIADALYEAAGKAKRDEPSVMTAQNTPQERSLGELVEEADKRFLAAYDLVKPQQGMAGIFHAESDKALMPVFQTLLAAVMWSSRKREILKALLG